MVSKNQIKLIRSLSQKKFRNKHGMFLVEGLKGINEFLNSSYKLEKLFSTTIAFDVSSKFIERIDEAELKKISLLKTPQEGLAIFKIPVKEKVKKEHLILALDGIRDPGNLGTIIRLCDWYGIETIVCSLDTVDCYNPKTVQASMGSLSRVNVHYTDLKEFIAKPPKLPVYGAFLEGDNVYSKKLNSDGILVMGNEANGISSKIEALIENKIYIPQFNQKNKTESLNVAIATAILVSEFRRTDLTER